MVSSELQHSVGLKAEGFDDRAQALNEVTRESHDADDGSVCVPHAPLSVHFNRFGREMDAGQANSGGNSDSYGTVGS